ncbi:MAG: hypothetical protein ABH829_01005 [archaeon]
MDEEFDPLAISSMDYIENLGVEQMPEFHDEPMLPANLTFYQRLLLKKERLFDRLRPRQTYAEINDFVEDAPVMVPTFEPAQERDEVLDMVRAKVEALESLEDETMLGKFTRKRDERRTADAARRLDAIRRMTEAKAARDMEEEAAREEAARQREEEIRRLQDEQLKLKRDRIRQEKVNEYYRTFGGAPKVERLRQESRTEMPVRMVIRPAYELLPVDKPKSPQEYGGIKIRKIML